MRVRKIFTNVLAFAVLLLLPRAVPAQGKANALPKQNFAAERARLVAEDIQGAGIENPRVIAAIGSVPRHEFVPLNQRKLSYLDMALPIGDAQTISPPYIVAFMTEQLDPQPTDRVLEIGTGSGYQAAVLSRLVKEVYTIEIVAPLGRRAAKTLKQLGYDNVFAKVGDGFLGWPQKAPFDKIIVTCSPEQVPVPLANQLKEGGRMVIPVGERYQQTMYLLTKRDGRLVPEALKPTLFVPMTGEAEAKRLVQPDPTRPALHNGDFEEVVGKPPSPTSWYYQRQMDLVTGEKAPSGKNYVLFHNAQPGRNSWALQGFPLDGRKVKQIDLSMMIRGKELRPGPGGIFPHVQLTFYDENRADLGTATVGGWRDTFDWRPEVARVNVPIRAREGILMIGLGGGIGELGMDNVQVRAAPAK